MFVDLSDLDDPRRMTAEIARHLDVREGGGPPTEESLIRFLSGRRMLIVLDNLEHLVDQAPVLTRLVAQTEGPSFLPTGRVPLNSAGEGVFDVGPLELSTARDGTGAARAANPAVALFVERALVSAPSLCVDDEIMPLIEEVCRALDGLPLALELAAARLRVISLREVVVNLERDIDVLGTRARDDPARQRTLRQTLEWSHSLLDADATILFRRLAVFSGGFTLEAAEQVCTDEELPDIVDALTALVESSLLHREGGAAWETRYRMLKTVQRFALGKLSASLEAEGFAVGHAEYFARRLDADVGRRVYSEESPVWPAQSSAGLLCRARPSCRCGRGTSTRRRRMLVKPSRSGRRRLQSALPIARRLGEVARVCGDLEEAAPHYRESEALLRSEGDRGDLARLIHTLGHGNLSRNEAQKARSRFVESLRMFVSLGNRRGIAECLANISVLLTSADRKIVEELCEARPDASVTIGPHMWRSRTLGTVVQQTPAASTSRRAPGRSTVRVYEVCESIVVDEALELGYSQ